MENNLAYVKKYKAVLNFIICTIISLLMCAILFICLQFDSVSDEIDFWFYFDFVITCLTFIPLFAVSISVLIKQLKFNKLSPKYYISLVDQTTFMINEKLVYVKDIKDVSYEKIHKWELFGELKESNIGTTFITRYKFQEKLAENAAQKARSKYRKSVQKSNLGTIIIELKSSSKIILKRVNDVESAVDEIKKIIKENAGE